MFRIEFAIVFFMAASMLTELLYGLNSPVGRIENDLTCLQEKLKNDEILLEYELTDSSLNLIAVTTSAILYSSQSVNSRVLTILKKFKKSMKTAGFYDFFLLGQTLYEFLVSPVEDLLMEKKRMIIVTGEFLSGLPFETLIRCHDPFGPSVPENSHYLVQDFEIIYHRSHARYKEKFVQNPEPEFIFLGYSPLFNDRTNSFMIPFSRREILEIGRLFKKNGVPAKKIMMQVSGKETFKQNISKAKIIHLATHYISGQSGDRQGGFIFTGFKPEDLAMKNSKGILTRDEIHNLQLNADLLVLNTCASQPEEINGAKNILSTIWNVSDSLGHRFILAFYRYWLSGMTFSEALREVKLQMISKPETALPLVWAPYVLTSQ